MVFLNETINIHSAPPGFSFLCGASVKLLFLTIGIGGGFGERLKSALTAEVATCPAQAG